MTSRRGICASWMALVFGVALAVAVITTSRSASAELKYSKIDDATVRLFAHRTVNVDRLKAKSGRAYVMAVPDAGHGSGIVVSNDGLVLTARHVVEGARLSAVMLPGQPKPLPVRLVYSDAEHDHAFLAIPGKYEQFVEIPKTGPKLAVRDTVFVVGYPLDARRDRPQSQQGIVSGKLPDGSLQLGIALNLGNSGGPVVDASEHLLGIAVARADPQAGAQGIGIAVPIEQILPGYKRVLGSTELKNARKLLADDAARLQSEADLVAALLTSEDSENSFRALLGEKTSGPGSRAVSRWLETASSPSADALALAAAEHWNTAAVLADQKRSMDAELAEARRLGKRAADLDRTLAGRSAFIEFLLARNDPTKVDANVPGADGEPGAPTDAQEAAARATLMRSLETSKTLPVVRFGPTIGLWAPFQLFGGGATVKLLLAQRVNLNARYQYGFHSENDKLKGSHAFEALAGFAVGTWNDKTTAQLVVDVESNPGLTIYHYVPGEVPTVHTLVVEGGVMSGPINITSTDPLLAGSEQARQIYVFEAGLRYTYFYQAKSEYLTGPARSTVELSAHALAPPLGIPEDSMNADGKRISRTKPGAKAEVSWGKAPLSLGLWEIGAGYLPAGEWYYLRVGWTYLFYP